MKINKAFFFTLLALFIVITIWNPQVNAGGSGASTGDQSGGGSTAVSVADVVYSAAGVETLAKKIDAIMAEYEKEASAGRKKELLNQAKDILTKLDELVNNIESEISILSKKKLDKVYAEKLERILSRITQLRDGKKQMLAVKQAG